MARFTLPGFAADVDPQQQHYLTPEAAQQLAGQLVGAPVRVAPGGEVVGWVTAAEVREDDAELVDADVRWLEELPEGVGAGLNIRCKATRDEQRKMFRVDEVLDHPELMLLRPGRTGGKA